VIHSTSVTVAALDEAARHLQNAAAQHTPCPPVRALIGDSDIDAGYAVQQRLTCSRIASGARVVGRKIGLTSTAVQAQLGVDRPDFGFLFDDMAVDDGGVVDTGRLLQPKIEAEVAFVLGADLADGPLDDEQIRAAVDHACAALEIVDSRIANWDITFGDTVADNASSGLFVLGARTSSLHDFEPVNVEMTMRRVEEIVSTGSGAACLGDPLAALAWLARTARQMGDPLRAGQLVLSGALGPMVPVVPGDTFTADLGGLGTVSVSFTAGATPHDRRGER
jgi:2-keto-4-pentenoate hydratase